MPWYPAGTPFGAGYRLAGAFEMNSLGGLTGSENTEAEAALTAFLAQFVERAKPRTRVGSVPRAPSSAGDDHRSIRRETPVDSMEDVD